MGLIPGFVKNLWEKFVNDGGLEKLGLEIAWTGMVPDFLIRWAMRWVASVALRVKLSVLYVRGPSRRALTPTNVGREHGLRRENAAERMNILSTSSKGARLPRHTRVVVW